MSRFIICTLAASALALAACGGNSLNSAPPGGGTAQAPPSSTAGVVSLDLAKAEYAAEAAYNAALLAANAAVDSGLLHGAQAAQVRQLLTTAGTALQAARAAETLGDTVTAQIQTGNVITAAFQASQIVAALRH